MSDFNAELQGKAYQLVNGTIDLDEFKSWYKLAIVAQAPARQAEPTPAIEPFTPPPVKLKQFDDYAKQPVDDDMIEHHRRIAGTGDE